MSRELKRVPLNFDAPLHRIWKGYINPYFKFSRSCPFCGGSGESPESKRLHDLWYGQIPFNPEDNGSKPHACDHPAIRNFAIKNTLISEFTNQKNGDVVSGSKAYWELFTENGVDAYVSNHPELKWKIESESHRLANLFNEQWCHHLNEADVKALLDEDCLDSFTGYPLNEKQKVEYEAVKQFNDEELSRRKAADWKNKKSWKPWKVFNNGYIPTPQEVNDWSMGGWGHTSTNSWVCIKARMKRERLGAAICSHCKGNGTIWLTPLYKKKCEKWKPKDPPKGEGFQLWATTNEGEPFSPVFKTLEDLCEWCAENATTFSNFKATKEEWMSMLNANFVYHKEGNNIYL